MKAIFSQTKFFIKIPSIPDKIGTFSRQKKFPKISRFFKNCRRYCFQAHQIANLIREYMEVLQSPPEIPRRDSTMAQQLAAQQQQQQYQQPPASLTTSAAGGRKSRPASMLHRGAPVIQSQAS